MSKRISLEELQSYLWNSAVLLRTSIDAGAYKQYIFPLLFFKRICDVYDEETQQIEEEYGEDAADFDEEEVHTFVVPKGYHWNDVRAVSENVGVAIVEAFRKVESANSEKLQGIFGDGAWTRTVFRIACSKTCWNTLAQRLSRSKTALKMNWGKAMNTSSKSLRTTVDTLPKSFIPTEPLYI